jgi:hypothetical protein
MATKANKYASYENHFDGERFYNVPDRPHPGLGDGIKWFLNRDRGLWDAPRSDLDPGEAPP